MAEYMLDTDISSYIMKRSHEVVLRRLRKVPIGVVCISVITKSELLFGSKCPPGGSRIMPPSISIYVTSRSWIFLTKQPFTMPRSVRRSKRVER